MGRSEQVLGCVHTLRRNRNLIGILYGTSCVTDLEVPNLFDFGKEGLKLGEAGH